MAEKSINQFVQEMKQAFGSVEFIATNNATGQVVASEGYKEPAPMTAINVEDFLRLGNMRVGNPAPSAEAIALMMNLALGKK